MTSVTTVEEWVFGLVSGLGASSAPFRWDSKSVLLSLIPLIQIGFYIIVILLAAALVLNIIAPETRPSPYRKSVTEVYDWNDNFITHRMAKGEIKLHISAEGPKYWFREIWAGINLTTRIMCQVRFTVLAFYLGWIYAQIVLVIAVSTH